jgi:DNA invertase Pin-like site-specific DNA recombinase
MSIEKLKSLHARIRQSLVGYIRVSTIEQMDDGNGLEAQRRAIEQYAQSQRRKLVHLYTDSHSGALPYDQRSNLKAAVRKAEELGCSILVSSPDRLSRNLDVLQHLDLRKTPIWVVGRGRLTRSDLEREIAKAAGDLDQRREAGVLSWSTAARRKRSPGNTQRMLDGARVGSTANQIRAHRNDIIIMEVLETRPEAKSMNCRELAQFLNELGLKNDNGRDPNGPVLWTTSTLRRPLHRVRQAIEANSEPLEVGFFPVDISSIAPITDLIKWV